MTTFEEAVEPIKQQFMRRRISAFAKKNNVTNEDVEVVDDMDLEVMEREFKRNNNIKARLYKNMTEEQQKAWTLYYDDHKKLSLKVKDGAKTSTKTENKIEKESISEKTEKVEKAEKQVKTSKGAKHKAITEDLPVKVETENIEPLKPAKTKKSTKSIPKPEKVDKTDKQTTNAPEVKKPRKIVHHKKQATDEK